MLKKILIFASMICVLVSSLVVVSFADEIDESVKYNYERYIEYTYSDLSSSHPSDLVAPLSGEFQDVMLIFEFSDDTRVVSYGSSIIWNFGYNDTYKEYGYQLENNGSLICQWGFRFDGNSDTFIKCFYKTPDVNEVNSTIKRITLYYNGSLSYDVVNNDVLSVEAGLVENPSSPSYLLSLLFTGFGTAIGGLALGVKESLSNVIWVDPAATNKVLSPLVTFIFTIAGLSIVMTVFFLIFRLIRFGRQR